MFICFGYFPNRDELLKECQARSLGGRLIEPADVANVAYLLCLPESEMIKGQTIFVDGLAHLLTEYVGAPTWLTALLARRPTKVAAIALARMAWAMMAKGERYKEPVALAA